MYALRVHISTKRSNLNTATTLLLLESEWPYPIAHPTKPPVRHKDHGDTSYTSLVIAHFGSKIWCHGNGSQPRKNTKKGLEGKRRVTLCCRM